MEMESDAMRPGDDWSRLNKAIGAQQDLKTEAKRVVEEAIKGVSCGLSNQNIENTEKPQKMTKTQIKELKELNALKGHIESASLENDKDAEKLYKKMTNVFDKQSSKISTDPLEESVEKFKASFLYAKAEVNQAAKAGAFDRRGLGKVSASIRKNIGKLLNPPKLSNLIAKALSLDSNAKLSEDLRGLRDSFSGLDPRASGSFRGHIEIREERNADNKAPIKLKEKAELSSVRNKHNIKEENELIFNKLDSIGNDYSIYPGEIGLHNVNKENYNEIKGQLNSVKDHIDELVAAKGKGPLNRVRHLSKDEARLRELQELTLNLLKTLKNIQENGYRIEFPDM